MRARKIESGLLVLVAVLAQSAMVQSVAMADSSAGRSVPSTLRTSKSGPRASTVAGESSSAISTTGFDTNGSFGACAQQGAGCGGDAPHAVGAPFANRTGV